MFGQFIKRRVGHTPKRQARTNSRHHAPPYRTLSKFPDQDTTASSQDDDLRSLRQQWQERCGDNVMAVYKHAEEVGVGVLRINSVEENDSPKSGIQLSVNALSLADDVHGSDQLHWQDAFELRVDQLFYFELLTGQLKAEDVPDYRKAIGRLATVARLLEMNA